MIIIPDNIIEFCPGSKYYKQRLRLLEETLRKLGNFESTKNIISTCSNTFSTEGMLLTVKDLDNTIFNFYSFVINGYQKNYLLTMKRNNSLFTYTYDFDKWDGYYTAETLRLISISYQLPTKKLLKLELTQDLRLVLEENTKSCILVYRRKKEDTVLKDLEEIIEKIKSIEELNLERLISTIPEQENLMFCRIMKNDKEIANLNFKNGYVISYKIYDVNKTIEVTIEPKKITRKVSRDIDKEVIETRTALPNRNQIEEDYKVLMCKL